MVYLELFLSFLKLGVFSFGGGYAMVPLIQQEIFSHGWINSQQFADMVAVSQMTPGPMAVNIATYVGYKIAGILGSTIATLGVFLPALILCILAVRILQRFRTNSVVQGIMGGIKPATLGLIASAFFFFFELSVFVSGIPGLHLFTRDSSEILKNFGVSWGGLVIFLLITVAHGRFKLGPILSVILAGCLGLFLC